MRKEGPRTLQFGARQPYMKTGFERHNLNSDLLSYINVPYIRNYYSDIEYVFSTLQAAYIVDHAAGITMQKRFDAWNAITDTLSDEKLPPLAAVTGEKTIFEFLKAYMKGFNEDIKDFCSFNPEYVYVTSCGPGVFTTIEKAMKYGDDRRTDELTIWKMKPDERPVGEVRYNCENNLVWIYLNDGKIPTMRETFWNMWFDFPTPYKAGDLIWIPGMKETMFVVKGKPELTEEERAEYQRLGDTTDMCLEGWLVYEDTELGDVITTSLPHLEYSPYTKELSDAEKAKVEKIQKRL